MSVLLDPPAVALALKRMAGEIVTRDLRSDDRPPYIIGIRRGGEPLAKRIAALFSAGAFSNRATPQFAAAAARPTMIATLPATGAG